jgi:hypothetical protein
VHIQVMDITGSTTFILFDHIVQNYVDRSVQDLIEANSQVNYDHFGYSFFLLWYDCIFMHVSNLECVSLIGVLKRVSQ